MAAQVFLTSILVLLALITFAKFDKDYCVLDSKGQEIAGALILLNAVVVFCSGIWAIWS